MIVVISKNLEWSAATIAELYKRRWQIGIFFKLIKQNLQVKTFLGTSENPCKSQIFIAMIFYLLLELIRRNISRVYHCFGHFVTLMRVYLTQYNRLEYIAIEIQITVQKAKKRYKPPDTSQKVTAIRVVLYWVLRKKYKFIANKRTFYNLYIKCSDRSGPNCNIYSLTVSFR